MKKKTKNSDYVYACSWHHMFGTETLFITKISVTEKDPKKIKKSLNANYGHSFYYCDTLAAAVKSQNINIEEIDFGNISKKEIEQVKKEVAYA